MPRRDRSFTAQDILRFYCRNLSVDQRRLVEAVGLVCDGGAVSTEDLLSSLFAAITSPPLSYAVERVPLGPYILDAMELFQVVVGGGVSPAEVEWMLGGGAVLPYIPPASD